MVPRIQESTSAIDADIAKVRFEILDCETEAQRSLLFRRIWLWSLFPVGLLPPAAVFAVHAGFARLERSDTAVIAYIGAGVLGVALAALWIRMAVKLRLRILELKKNRAKLRESLKSLTSRRITEDDDDETLAALKHYRHDVADLIEEYKGRANHYRRISNYFQILIIAGSILTTSITSAAAQAAWLRLAAPFVSIIVGLSAGFTGYFKFKERSLNLQQTADAIEHEYNAVELRIHRYRLCKDAQDALVTFAEEVERLKEEQSKREQQLEQPPDLRDEKTRA